MQRLYVYPLGYVCGVPPFIHWVVPYMYIRIPSIFAAIFLLPLCVFARTIDVTPGGAYASLEDAAAVAVPGDTILFHPGVYAGGESITTLQGRPDAWITIRAVTQGQVILRGGGNSWQISDGAYLRIEGFVIEGQTGNGMNIDDAGTFETPSHHLLISRCEWRGIDATGNNDQLKMSGIDSFEVSDCIFRDGSPGGSMIDMVGCHNGRFSRNRFERAGSNSIQAKGGTRWIRIERNAFIDGGARAVNIGGSTGLQYFRPQGATYESADIDVYSNLFVGATTAIAFVGTINSRVINNTIIRPGRWVFRILQETTAPEFQQCGNNTFAGNIVVVDSLLVLTVNIGPNTRPETFSFANNLWYHETESAWTPLLPAAESGAVIGENPMLIHIPDNITPGPGSAAIGAGPAINEPVFDYLGHRFVSPRSIGAIEAGQPVMDVPDGRDPFWEEATVPTGGPTITGVP